MRPLPQAVSASYPDPAGLPFPSCGIRGLHIFLASPDPSAVHDAFTASALVGANGAVECWLDAGPHQDEPPAGGDAGSSQSTPSARRYSVTCNSRGAATEAIALANDQLAEWARMLGLEQPGNLTFKLCSPASYNLLPSEAFHLAAVSGLPLNSSDALAAMLAALYSSLKVGGELFVSALLCNRRLGAHVSVEELDAAGVGPVSYFEDFISVLRSAGFQQPRVVRIEPWDLEDADELAQLILLNSKLSTFQIRAQKNRLLEDTCEDYGQWAVYKGTLEGSDEAFTLDMHHRLVRNQPTMVCGNTAAMLGEASVSWLSEHFIISGDRSVHYGSFTGGAPRSSRFPERCCS